MLPVKFCQQQFSVFRGDVENVSSNQRQRRSSLLTDRPKQKKILGRGLRYDIVSWLLDKLYCCRYRRYRYDIVMFLLYQLIQLYCCRYHRYRYDIVMFLLEQLYCCRYRRYRFDIDTISFHDCRISCIAVDIVDIDTISFHDCWISCIAVDIVDIDTISSCSCCINCIVLCLGLKCSPRKSSNRIIEPFCLRLLVCSSTQLLSLDGYIVTKIRL